MARDKRSIADLYRKRARHYDVSANAYYLLGLREFAYRRMAVDALNVNPGDTVVEIGCGTGLNFGLLQAKVGVEGRIIGVDLTPEMLARAEERAKCQGWSNVELVQSDATEYRFPERPDGILSTFALTLIPEYDQVIRNGADALPVGKRFVILDFKEPKNCHIGSYDSSPLLLIRLASRSIWHRGIPGNRWIDTWPSLSSRHSTLGRYICASVRSRTRECRTI